MFKFHEAGSLSDIALGYKLISEGKVGCIVLAGGDGSRLGWSGPKGTFPILPDKTLFQLLEERLEAASAHFGRELKCAIMTSPRNDKETREAFAAKVDFFTQEELPLLDLSGNPIAEKRPGGNGDVFKCFSASGLFKKWKNGGIKFVQVILIDNPLADPFDANQIGVHANTEAEVTIKAVLKLNAEEKVGVIGEKNGKICIIEYSENPPKDWNLASIGLFSFSMDFIQGIKNVKLPEHRVKREFEGKPVIKRETFIFDLLPYSEKTEVILYPREKVFAPLKSMEDIPLVQKALQGHLKG